MGQDPNTETVLVTEEAAGQRLDKVLADALPELSRARVQALLADGQVRGKGGKVQGSPSRKVKSGEVFSITLPPPVDPTPKGQAIDLDILYEDDDVIVLNKPPGMVVHPAAGNHDGTLVNALIAHCGDSLSGIGGVRRPGIVHRLDKQTSGIMVVAKNDKAHKGLAKQFADHSIDRIYLALVWGAPKPPLGTVDANVGRHPKSRTKHAVLREGGRHAVTHYKVLQSFGPPNNASSGPTASLVSCQLETGRTHQIRLHMAHLGHPVIGDPLYGTGRKSGAKAGAAGPVLDAFGRQALHAAELGFDHPVTGKRLNFSVKPPHDMQRLLDALGGV